MLWWSKSKPEEKKTDANNESSGPKLKFPKLAGTNDIDDALAKSEAADAVEAKEKAEFEAYRQAMREEREAQREAEYKESRSYCGC